MTNNESETVGAPNFDVPDYLSYSEDHAWVDSSVDPVVVGITAYAADELGDLVFVDLPKVGTRVEAGDEIAELESAKAVEPLISPVSGVVAYTNNDVAQDPSVINSDPYGEGWILKVTPDDDEPELLDAEEYVKVTKQ
ncbi:MAG: glycine cleavage system protein GcvH [Bifidobacteriaceae bacterium]|jgi:glycine cleavage system H protein|nr:glycine cleavage system protein GcvH [Bifidobacteriaceae bacterium]